MGDKWEHLNFLLHRTGPLAPPPEAFEPGPQVNETLAEKRVLLVGAGGLGCEILKDLALSGVKDITVCFNLCS